MKADCKLIFLIIFVLLISGCASNKEAIVNPVPNWCRVKINQTQVKAEVIKDNLAMIKGLSGRKSLERDRGMLFVFDKSEKLAFWMKGMEFPLDIIFINAKNAKDAKLRKCERFITCEYGVVDLVESLPQPQINEEPASYQSKEPANYVLEVNAGFIKDNAVKIGDRVDIIW